MTGESGSRRSIGRRTGLRRWSGGRCHPSQLHADPTILRPVGRAGVRNQRVLLAMEAHGDLRFSDAVGLEEVDYRQCAATRQFAVGQPVAAVVGMAVEFDVIDRRIGLHVLEHHLQPGLGVGIQIGAFAREAYLRLFDLIEILRQQFRHTRLVFVESLAELDGQQAHFRHPAIPGSTAHHRAATVEQTADQATGLRLRTVEQHIAGADPDTAQIDIVASWLPWRRRREQGRRTTAEHGVERVQAKNRLLAGLAHELARAEIGDRLGQTALELVALDRPLNVLQTSLVGQRHRGEAGKHTEQG
eukprot:Opistho-2@38155